jgi:Tfp pilus assembly protein PilF
LEPARKALEIDPNSAIAHITLGNTYLHKAMFDQAMAEFQRAKQLLGESTAAPSFSIVLTYAMSGEDDKAEALLEELLAHSEDRYVSPMPIAAIYSALGEKDRALDWLEKAYEERSTHLPLFGLYPQLHALRSETRFQDLLRRMNLPLPESPVGEDGGPATGRAGQP